ncbi:peroxidasin homolog [Ruditapes philippinarum]|uniref:peroxidasin homolog n=1 Tax=Ruditapes philippinarum TaxID=129788 RepID=UPI00295BAD1B|nr:peroxidasin homolog [Ruditapes philippinarum]
MTQSTTSLDIDVRYRSKILQFSVTDLKRRRKHFEVTENETVLFICSVDSNPVSSIAISLKQRELVRSESTNSLSSAYRVNSCLDGGVYQCAAHNIYNIKPSLKNVTLLVRCIPLLSPEFDLKTNITSAENVTVTFAFKAIAYPAPEFLWYKFDNSSWKTISSDVKYEIRTRGHYSSLTISVITEEDYGQYKLRIHNAVGFLEQLYFLNANATQQTTYSTMKWVITCVSVGTFVFTISVVVMVFIRRRGTLNLSVTQTAEIISGSQTSLNFNPDVHTVHTMHAYSQLYEHCFDDERYTELQTLEADKYPNRGYLTPAI